MKPAREWRRLGGTVVGRTGEHTSLLVEDIAADAKISRGGNRARKTVTYIDWLPLKIQEL